MSRHSQTSTVSRLYNNQQPLPGTPPSSSHLLTPTKIKLVSKRPVLAAGPKFIAHDYLSSWLHFTSHSAVDQRGAQNDFPSVLHWPLSSCICHDCTGCIFHISRGQLPATTVRSHWRMSNGIQPPDRGLQRTRLSGRWRMFPSMRYISRESLQHPQHHLPRCHS